MNYTSSYNLFLLVKILHKRRCIRLTQNDAFPEGGEETSAITEQLHERSKNGLKGNGNILVSDQAVDENHQDEKHQRGYNQIMYKD